MPAAQAGQPSPLYTEPVKVDASGRPIYNGWEMRENTTRPDQQRRNSSMPSVAPGTPSQINPTDGMGGGPGMSPGMPVPMSSMPTQGPMPQINQLDML